MRANALQSIAKLLDRTSTLVGSKLHLLQSLLVVYVPGSGGHAGHLKLKVWPVQGIWRLPSQSDSCCHSRGRVTMRCCWVHAAAGLCERDPLQSAPLIGPQLLGRPQRRRQHCKHLLSDQDFARAEAMHRRMKNWSSHHTDGCPWAVHEQQSDRGAWYIMRLMSIR